MRTTVNKRLTTLERKRTRAARQGNSEEFLKKLAETYINVRQAHADKTPRQLIREKQVDLSMAERYCLAIFAKYDPSCTPEGRLRETEESDIRKEMQACMTEVCVQRAKRDAAQDSRRVW